MKKCSSCKIEKPYSDFYKRGDGYKSHCKKCSSVYMRRYYSSNKEIHNSKMKEHYKLKKTEYQKKNENYRKNNRQKINEIAKKYNKKRKKDDLLYRLVSNMRGRLYHFLNTSRVNSNNKTMDLVGCEPKKLKEYLEMKFDKNMKWENYGEWHIDHIIPLSSAKNEKQLYKLCHYTNLQPLWALENIKKGAKLI